MLSYSAFILFGTAWFAVQTDFSNTRELFRGLIRVVGMTGLAFWLLTLEKWAWRFSIAACAFISLIGVIGVLAIGFVGVTHDSSFFWHLLQLVAPLYLLGHATFLLAKAETRQHFRGKPA